ncbi:hypothetical protein PM082_023918 [Marasmius tenuissimus]|nr:hypothetical protein PM082_023918 [Marasmius tenuissimus]
MARTYIILFYASVTILCHREGNPKARSALLVAIVLIFIISSFEIWTDVAVVLTGIQRVFVDKIGTSFIKKQAAYGEQFSTVVSVQEALGPLEIVLGDSIVFWRVWALCAGQKKLVFVPFVFLVGTAVCSLGFFGCFAYNGWPVANPPTCNNLIISAYSLSMVTNISGTVVIGLKFWCVTYRLSIPTAFDAHDQVLPAKRRSISQ